MFFGLLKVHFLKKQESESQTIAVVPAVVPIAPECAIVAIFGFWDEIWGESPSYLIILHEQISIPVFEIVCFNFLACAVKIFVFIVYTYSFDLFVKLCFCLHRDVVVNTFLFPLCKDIVFDLHVILRVLFFPLGVWRFIDLTDDHRCIFP